MTYDVLEKVSKKDLITWMRRNVRLPNITDEQFLKKVRLERLLAEEKKLLDEDEVLNEKLSAATDNPIEFMRLMVESQKLNERLNNISKNISQCMNL